MSIKRELEKLKKGAEFYESTRPPKVDVPASVILSAITARWERHNGSLALDAGFEDEKKYEVRRFLESMREPPKVAWDELPPNDVRKVLLDRFSRIAASLAR
ncbi:MAG: hypothetical protein ABW208_13440 [Pyrinomonadaceae bacterium]